MYEYTQPHTHIYISINFNGNINFFHKFYTFFATTSFLWNDDITIKNYFDK